MDPPGWVHAVGAGLVVVGLWFGVAWLIGERARDRRWCKRCRYDMDGAPGPVCPECGWQARGVRSLRAPRRRRRLGVSGVAMCLCGAYTLSVARAVTDVGPLMVVPTWALMAGWDMLPDPWLCETPNTALDGTLEDRLSHADGVSPERRLRFTARLLRGMDADRSTRWDPMRLTLIAAGTHGIRDGSTYDRDDVAFQPLIEAVGAERLNHLLDLIGQDIVRATTTTTPDEADINIQSRDSGGYDIVRDLVVWHIAFEQGWTGGSGWPKDVVTPLGRELRAVLTGTHDLGVKAPMRVNWLDDQYQSMYEHPCLGLACDAGFSGMYIQEFFDTTEGQGLMDVDTRAHWSAIAAIWSGEADRRRALDRLLTWANDDDPLRRAEGFRFAKYWASRERWGAAPGLISSDPAFRSIVRSAVTRGDSRAVLRPLPGRDDGASLRVCDEAAQLIVTSDPNGGLGMPILRAMLLDGVVPIAPCYRGWPRPDSVADEWVCNFADLVGHPDPLVRLWLANTAECCESMRQGSRIDDVLARLAADSDGEVAEAAEAVMESRSYRVQP